MSFGFSIGDFVQLTQLAWTTVQNARLATGAHHELTRELISLHIVLQRLEKERSKRGSLLNQTDDDRRTELATILRGCRRLLRTFANILDKYNGLPSDKKSVTSLWEKVRFGNGEMQDLSKMRLELVTHTNAITMFLNLLLLGSQGNIESLFNDQGKDLRHLRQSIDWIAASMEAKMSEGSVLTSYTDDDKTAWRELRRELIGEGFSSTLLKKHETLIKEYILELGSRGALDSLGTLDEGDEDPEGIEGNEQQSSSSESDAESQPANYLALDQSSSALSKSRNSHAIGFEVDPYESLERAYDPHKNFDIALQPRFEGVKFSFEDRSLRTSEVIRVALSILRPDYDPEDFCLYSIQKYYPIKDRYLREYDRPLWQLFYQETLSGVPWNFSLRRISTRPLLHRALDDSWHLANFTSHLAFLRPVHLPQTAQSDQKSDLPNRRASPSDRPRFNIDAFCQIDHWNPDEEPIRLFGSIFDSRFLCAWIYDAASMYDKFLASRKHDRSWEVKLASPKAAKLRGSVLKFKERERVLKKYLPHILPTSNRQIFQSFISRSCFIFDYFQELIAAAQYTALGLKVLRFTGESYSQNAMTGDLLDYYLISGWESDSVEQIGTRALVDLIWFMFEEAWDDLSYFILDGIEPWIEQIEQDCLSIIREAYAESLRTPTWQEQAAQALVIYTGLKIEEKSLVLYTKPQSYNLPSRRLILLEEILALRRGELMKVYDNLNFKRRAADHALAAFRKANLTWPEEHAEKFEMLGRLVLAKEKAERDLDSQRHLLFRLECNFIPFRDYFVWGRVAGT